MREAADVVHALRMHLFTGPNTTDEHFAVRRAHHITDIALQRTLPPFAWSPRHQRFQVRACIAQEHGRIVSHGFVDPASLHSAYAASNSFRSVLPLDHSPLHSPALTRTGALEGVERPGVHRAEHLAVDHRNLLECCLLDPRQLALLLHSTVATVSGVPRSSETASPPRTTIGP